MLVIQMHQVQIGKVLDGEGLDEDGNVQKVKVALYHDPDSNITVEVPMEITDARAHAEKLSADPAPRPEPESDEGAEA